MLRHQHLFQELQRVPGGGAGRGPRSSATGSHVVQRGSAGRSPDIWVADLRAAYDLRVASGRWRPRLMLDVSNLGNQRRALDIDLLHYTDAAHTVVNPSYQGINRYQAPLSARVGLVLGF